MKHLIIIRHAKSSWEDSSLPDYKRPLNKRGRRDAPYMAELLAEKIKTVDAIVSSHAKRAHDTAKVFAEALAIPEEQILIKPRLYNSTVAQMQLFVEELDNNWKRVCLFGHNPTFTEFANVYAPPTIDNVPTCGIVHFRSSAEDWNDFDQSNTSIMQFYYPKQFKK